METWAGTWGDEKTEQEFSLNLLQQESRGAAARGWLVLLLILDTAVLEIIYSPDIRVPHP